MIGPFPWKTDGRKVLVDKKKEIQDAIFAYYGAMDERKARAAPGVREMLPEPEAPDILVCWEQVKAFNALPWAGGLSDQPFQYMFELSCVDQVVSMRERIQAANNANQRQ